MRTALLALALFFTLSGTACAETIRASVNGMVCAFCATGIEKTFRAQPEVDDVRVDLERKLVMIRTKEGRTLDDARIGKIMTDAGYSINGIVREEKNEPAR